jgi:hypothetical protein
MKHFSTLCPTPPATGASYFSNLPPSHTWRSCHVHLPARVWACPHTCLHRGCPSRSAQPPSLPPVASSFPIAFPTSSLPATRDSAPPGRPVRLPVAIFCQARWSPARYLPCAPLHPCPPLISPGCPDPSPCSRFPRAPRSSTLH